MKVFITVAVVLFVLHEKVNFTNGGTISPESIYEEIEKEYMKLEDVVDPDIMERMELEKDPIGQISGSELTAIICKDVMDASQEVRVTGRSLQPKFCAAFCLEFYNWCRPICTQLIQEESNVFEILPCLATCGLHFVSCCFN